ncbi:MAG: BamA/TamA family outer membrane protein [Pseudomonadota bacterium]
MGRCRAGAQAVVLGIALLSANAVSAQSDATRTFDEIKVLGNSRFTDQQIIETSGLLTGQPLDRSDLLAAVESLEFTGEFENIQIFEAGNSLVIEVIEEPQASGALTGTLGADSDVGLIGSIGLRLNDTPVEGGSVTGRISLAEEFQRARIGVDLPTFAFGRPGGADLFFANEDFDENRFSYRTFGVEPYLVLQESAQSETRASLFAYSSDMFDVDGDASPILQAEEGQEDYVGLSLIHGRESGSERGLSTRLTLSQEVAFGSEDRSFATTSLSFSAKVPLGQSGLTLASTVTGAGVFALSGDGARAVDRFTLGGLSLRGFERGTIGPRDVCDACDPGGTEVSERLGGEFFAVARTELQAPIAPERFGQLKGFVFADMGSAWGLDTDTAPLGSLENGFDLRISGGVGLRWETEIATVEVYYGEPIEKLDTDEEQQFGFAIRTPF